jgi:ribonuclease Z
MKSLSGHPGQSGARAVTTEVPYDRPQVVYQRNGVTITSFPVIHVHNGAVGYRLDYAGRSVVFSGDTRPCRHLVEACDGADLLIHETFPTATVLSQKGGMPLPVAEMIVNGAHTSPAMAGMVFKRAGVRMSAMWHLVVDHGTIGPVFEEMRTQYDGPVVISQDLTVFNITKEAVVARQRTIDPYAWPVVGPSNVQGPPMSPPLEPPAWWADALITD